MEQEKLDPAGEHYSFTIPARAELRSAAAGFVTLICEDLVSARRLSEESAHQVMSAFLEGYNNVVTHAYQGQTRGSIELMILVSDTKMSMTIVDQGPGFDFDTIGRPDLDALPEGGMGLYIMKNFMDKVEYQKNGGRNLLLLVKELKSEKGNTGC